MCTILTHKVLQKLEQIIEIVFLKNKSHLQKDLVDFSLENMTENKKFAITDGFNNSFQE